MPALDSLISQRAPVPTHFGVGGGADRLAQPRTLDELGACLEVDPEAMILGDGANLLVDDPGVDRLVIDTTRLDENAIEIDEQSGAVRAPAGMPLPVLISRTIRAGLAGLEALAGIPARVGGAVMMNAGGAHGQIADRLTCVHGLGRDGVKVRLERGEIGFGYRSSGLGELIVTGAEFSLTPTDRGVVSGRLREYMAYKQQTQPLGARCAGCSFKNPMLPHDVAGIGEAGRRVGAGLLIDRAGCKGLAIASASVSRHHANFITATPGGRAGDVIGLLEEVQRRVFDCFGVRLEREVVIWRRST